MRLTKCCSNSLLVVLCLSVILVANIGLTGCGPAPVPPVPTDHPVGEVSMGEDEFGIFHAYVPLSAPPQPEIAVLVHGTPQKKDTAEFTARYYIQNWLDFAEENGFVLIVPVFNQEDFSSRRGDHAMTGYRGLFGRRINADAWVLRLVRAHQQALGLPEKPFYLYGHSAGGQFTGRFLVTHPEVVKRAVISSAATYPQPNPDVAWPFGMGPLYAHIEWDEETVNRVDILPDEQKWLRATQVPLTVIVGLNDRSELPQFPGQKGLIRYEIGQNWVRDMDTFAQKNGLESRFKFELIPGKGHSMSGLAFYSQQALVSDENTYKP